MNAEDQSNININGKILTISGLIVHLFLLLSFKFSLISFNIKALHTTLSCIMKCVRFVFDMINKKIIFGLFTLSFLSACATPTAMLGPAYTFTSTGSAFQTGLSYGSGELITMYTGKTTIENIKEISTIDENNIHKKTLESEDFYILVKNKIERTNGILKLSNQ